MLPLDALSNPATMRRSVVLPHPEGPSRTQNSPSATSKEISFKICVSPKVLEILLMVRDAMASSSVLPQSQDLTLYRSRRQALDDTPLKNQR
jgi:hypothetical protein